MYILIVIDEISRYIEFEILVRIPLRLLYTCKEYNKTRLYFIVSFLIICTNEMVTGSAKTQMFGLVVV